MYDHFVLIDDVFHKRKFNFRVLETIQIPRFLSQSGKRNGWDKKKGRTRVSRVGHCIISHWRKGRLIILFDQSSHVLEQKFQCSKKIKNEFVQLETHFCEASARNYENYILYWSIIIDTICLPKFDNNCWGMRHLINTEPIAIGRFTDRCVLIGDYLSSVTDKISNQALPNDVIIQ